MHGLRVLEGSRKAAGVRRGQDEVPRCPVAGLVCLRDRESCRSKSLQPSLHVILTKATSDLLSPKALGMCVDLCVESPAGPCSTATETTARSYLSSLSGAHVACRHPHRDLCD